MNLQGGSGIPLQQPTYTPQVAPASPQTNMVADPTSVLGANTTNTGTTGGTTGSTTPTNSAYQQSVLDNLQPSLNNLYSTSSNQGNIASRDYGQGILNFITNQRLGQNAVDVQGQQNELSRIQGSRGVLDTVGQGIKSGGVVLGNDNAGSSSASEALARAYGILGRTQQTGINNQYQQGLSSVQNAQNNFNIQQNAGVQGLGVTKQDAVDNIVNNASTQLQYLSLIHI